MILQEYIQDMLPAIRSELEISLEHPMLQMASELKSMLRYHMGWDGGELNQGAEGKRIRPMLTLLCSAAAGGVWDHALPAAAGVELIHNFSLIHDDIEDKSELRRGRETIWKKWDVAQAINTGDLLFAIANLALHRLERHFDDRVINLAGRILLETCVLLTRGQHWDIVFENQTDITINQYWTMVEGKTAALLSACCELGALCSPASDIQREQYKVFGFHLGMAFQAIDDYLGIWGDSSRTGKSTASDLISRKKTLPVIFGLQSSPEFSILWTRSSHNASSASDMSDILEADGAKGYVLKQAQVHTDRSFQALRKAGGQSDAINAIEALAKGLLQREK